MDEFIENNMLKIFYNNLVRATITKWSKERNRSFMACFRDVLEERNPNWKNSGLNARYILSSVIDYLNSTALAQIICYGYEIILMDEDVVNRMKENAGFKGKEKTYVSEDIVNDYQLMNFIRNAISHNNDLESNLYVYSRADENYTFTLNRPGQESSKVIMNKEDLVDFLQEYVNSSKLYKTYNTSLIVYLDNIMKYKSIKNSSQFLQLKLSDSDDFIELDENQEKVIRDMVNYIKKNDLINPNFIKLYYPYKQNVVNNYLMSMDFFCMMEALYLYRGGTFTQFVDELGELGLLNNRKMKIFEDLGDMFMINRIFQIFSTNDNKFIIENLEGVLPFEKYNKLRNAIMHGTYYRDFEGNLYFYDAPRGKKTEEGLKFIDVFSKSDFVSMSNALCSKKYSEKNAKNK